MGILNMLLRPFKSFNIENRTFKLLDKVKPTPAPKYKANIKELQQILKDHPNLAEEMATKNIPLDNRLKDVYVSSVEPSEIHAADRQCKQKLPQDRSPAENFEFGIQDPQHVPPGRLSLRNVFELYSVYEKSHRKMDLKELAEQFNISVESVELLIKYYGAFELLETLKNRRTGREQYRPLSIWGDSKQQKIEDK